MKPLRQDTDLLFQAIVWSPRGRQVYHKAEDGRELIADTEGDWSVEEEGYGRTVKGHTERGLDEAKLQAFFSWYRTQKVAK